MAIEVRLNDDGSLDEVVAKHCTFHLERMGGDEWWMSISVDGEETHVTLFTKRGAAILANVLSQAS